MGDKIRQNSANYAVFAQNILKSQRSEKKNLKIIDISFSVVIQQLTTHIKYFLYYFCIFNPPNTGWFVCKAMSRCASETE